VTANRQPTIIAHGDPGEACKNRRVALLADPKFTAYLDRLKTSRIGLVLSGGGGKGAYAAGVLLALFDCGIRSYSALSGTSVGALNAALCHELCRTQDRDVVLRVWGSMSFRKVLATSPIRLILALIVRALLIPVFVLNGVRQWILRKMRSTEFAIRFAHLSQLKMIGYRAKLRLLRALFEVATPYFLLALYVVCVFVVNSVSKTAPLANLNWILIAVIVVLSILNVFAIPFVARRLAFFDNAPLRTAITEAVNADTLWKSEIPIYCTMTGTIEAWVDTSDLRGENRWVYVPTYAKLQEMDRPESVLDVLLQSAAIPEVFPARHIHGGEFFDGYLVDNTPILPICLEKPKPEIIIVVYLDNKALKRANLRQRESDHPEVEDTGPPDLWLNEQARTFWLFDLVYRVMLRYEGDSSERLKYQNQRAEILADSWAFRFFDREAFFPIIPTKSLGGSGAALNFFAYKARDLLQLGYEDTLTHIERASCRENAGQGNG
jgi:predicted acylesterase/phospholipase RssA